MKVNKWKSPHFRENSIYVPLSITPEILKTLCGGLVILHGGQTNHKTAVSFTPMPGDFSHVTEHTSSLRACGASTVSILLLNM